MQTASKDVFDHLCHYHFGSPLTHLLDFEIETDIDGKCVVCQLFFMNWTFPGLTRGSLLLHVQIDRGGITAFQALQTLPGIDSTVSFSFTFQFL